METQRSEGEDLYEKEFQLLKTFSEELRNQPDYSSSEGDKDVNKKKNRYKVFILGLVQSETALIRYLPN